MRPYCEIANDEGDQTKEAQGHDSEQRPEQLRVPDETAGDAEEKSAHQADGERRPEHHPCLRRISPFSCPARGGAETVGHP
jgi:hypothetical protein